MERVANTSQQHGIGRDAEHTIDDELDPDAQTVVICHHGARSFQVAHFLERNGFQQLHNLAGGVDAWARTVNPEMPLY